MCNAKKIMKLIHDISAIYTVLQILMKLILIIIELCQNKNNPGGHLGVIFIYIILKIVE